jgi:hypothetical protein
MYSPEDVGGTPTFQVITLLRGDCENGEGQRLWIRKGARGWRVIKTLGGEFWATGSAAAERTAR